MKKFLLTVLFLLVVIVGGLGFFVARSFNADGLQKQIVRAISELTGREFTVMGPTFVSWVPSPEIILNDVTLSNVKGSTRGVMVSIPKVSIQLTWKSLLKQPPVIDEIKLENPIFYLERMDARTVNWNFPFLSKKTLETSDFSSKKSFIETSISNLYIKEGVINYTNAVTDTAMEITNVNGRLSLNSLHGPYVFDGSVQKGGISYLTSLNVNQLQSDVPVPFTFSMKAKDKSVSLDMTGEFSTMQKKLNLTASGSFSIQRPNEILKSLNLKPLDESLNVPVDGGLTYTSVNGVDGLKNLTLRFGDSVDAVSLNLSVTREKKNNNMFYDTSFSFTKFDYEQWKDILSDLEKLKLTDTKLPDFSLKANAITMSYKGKTIKDVELSLDKTGPKITVNSLKGLFAGNTEISAMGFTKIQEDETGLSLNVTGQTKDLKSFISPFVDTKRMNPHVLKSATFKGLVDIWPEKISADIESFEVEDSRLSGKFDIQKGVKPTIHFNGKVENVNVDNFIPYKPAKEKMDILDVIPAIKTYFVNADYLTKFNSNFNVDLKDVTVRNLPIRSGKLSGSLLNGLLKLAELRVSGAAMATLLAAGDVENIGTENAKINNIRFDFNTKELKIFLDRANLVSNNSFLNKTNTLVASLQASENKDVWTGVLTNTIGDLETRLSGELFYTQNDVSANNLTLEILYPTFQQFLKTVIGTKKINNSIDGAFSFKTILNGTPKSFKFTDADVQIGLNHLTMNGEVKNTDSQKVVNVKVQMPSFDVDKYMLNDFKNIFATGPAGNNSFNFSLLDIWQIIFKLETGQILWGNKELKDAIVDFSIQDKMLTLNKLSGTPSKDGSVFNVAGTLSWNDVPRMNADIDIQGLDLGANLLTGTKTSFGNGVLTLSGEINSIGQSPNEMRKKLTGKGKMNIENSLWIGADIQKITPLIAKTIKERLPKNKFDTDLGSYLHSGKTTLNSLSGNFTIDNGVLKMMDTSLKADTFYSNPMQVIYNIVDKNIDVSVPISLAAYPDLPPFALTLKGLESAPVYLSNFVDLSNSVEAIVQKGNTKIAEQLQKEQEKLAKITLTERTARIKKAITDARIAVKTAEGKLYAGDNDSAAFLLQNAKDALSIVNQLSIKETLTDAQYIQLMEQSRLAILKAQEAVDEAVRDLYFEDRKQVQTFVKQAREMFVEIVSVHEQNPHIEIVTKLINPVREYIDVLEMTNKKLSASLSKEEHAETMYMAREAFSKVVRAYEYVSRFMPDNTKRIVPISVHQIPNRDILSNEGEAAATAEEADIVEERSFQGTIQRM